MSVNSISSNSNNDGYKAQLTTSQQNVFSYFESIFNDLDKNQDGKIDDQDHLSSSNKMLADKMKHWFKILCNNAHLKLEFSMDSIKTLLNETSKKATSSTLDFAEKVIYFKMDKNQDGIVDEKDELTEDEKQIIDSFDKQGYNTYYIQHTQQEKYNGTDAEVTYNLDNKIIKLKTQAKEEGEAAELMGLKEPLWERKVDESSNKVRYYYKGDKELPGKIVPGDWYEWDDDTETMNWAGNL